MPLRSRVGVCLTTLGLLLAACGTEADEPVTANAPASTAASGAAVPVSTEPTTTDAATQSTTAPPGPVGTSNETVPTTAPESAESSASTTPTEPTAEVAPDCRRIADFDDDTGGWVIVNDGVMGGRSDGRVEFTDSAMRFTGDVVTRGGGFTSVRRAVGPDELSGTDRIVMRVRADDRAYGVTMEDASRSGRRAVSHRADLPIDAPTNTDDWSIVTIAYADLEPRVFGQPVDAARFDADTAGEIGIIIADGRDGEFALTVDWIDACR